MLFAYTRIAYRRQQDKVFLTEDLGVDVLVVVFVEGRNRAGVTDPQVGGVRVLLEGDPGKGDVLGNIA